MQSYCTSMLHFTFVKTSNDHKKGNHHLPPCLMPALQDDILLHFLVHLYTELPRCPEHKNSIDLLGSQPWFTLRNWIHTMAADSTRVALGCELHKPQSNPTTSRAPVVDSK